MELKLHLYSITWVTSMLKPSDPGSVIWNLELGLWHLEHGTWMLKLKETGQIARDVQKIPLDAASDL